MVLEAPSMFPEVRELNAPPGKGKHGYYKNIRGWIVIQSTTPSNRTGTEYKGGRFLSQYGEFVMDTNDPRGAPKAQDAKGNPWNSAVEPWRVIFQLGGAKEFPIDQIIAYRWHIRPPYREAVFPQLSETKVYDFFCPECDDRVFSSPNEREAVFQLRTHLTSGINTAHGYRPEDLRALGEQEGIDFFSNRVGTRGIRRSADAPAAVTEETVAEPSPLESTTVLCRVCGREFDSFGALGGHMKGHSKEKAGVGAA